MRAKHTVKNSLRTFLGLALILALVAIGLPLNISSVQAQAGPQLQNGGFDGDFVTVRGDFTKQVAEGWEPWNLSVAGDAQGLKRDPEYGKAPGNRVRSQPSAQEYNTFFAPHDAGLYQRVDVASGTKVKFSAFIYVWSSSDFSNVDVSADPLGVRVRVGIDPTGGINPESTSIVWSTEAEYYDEFRENSVEATASGTAITVFIRSTVEKANGINAVYVDDASLTVLEAGPTPTESDETPDPDATTPAPVTPVATTPAAPATTQAPTVTNTPGSEIPAATFTPTPTPPRTPVSDEFPNEVMHTVVFGDTIIGLAVRYDSSVDAILTANELSSSGLIFVNQQLIIPVRAGQGSPIVQPGGGQTDDTVYQVLGGDTLFSIAARFNTTVDRLAQYNNIVNPNQLFPGQEIRIPSNTTTPPPAGGPPTAAPIGQPSTGGQGPVSGGVSVTNPQNFIDPTGALIHIVQPGENVFRIGLYYNVTWDRIARRNGLFNPNFIIPGMRLVIPR